MEQSAGSTHATVIYDERPREFTDAIADRDALWLEAGELKRLIGWELKAEGACLGELCVPIAADRRGEFVRGQNRKSYFNFAALAGALRKPWTADLEHRLWYFGAQAAARAGALQTLKAPDFTLPDLGGKLHSLHEHLGKKVFLLAWASW